MRFIYSKTFAIFAICVMAAAFLVFLQVKGWLEPIRLAFLNAPRPVISLAKNVTTPVTSFFGTVYQLRKIVQENTELRAQVIELQQDLVLKDQQARENEALRKELGFVKNSKLQLVSCSVLSHDSDAVILNCGTDNGVQQGQAIISQGYLVGKITYVGKNSSTALLMTSSQFTTDARVSQTGDTALVKGSFGSGFTLEQVQQTSDLQTGWLVVTAGVNQQVPKNILIGEVGQLLSGGNDLFKKAALISPIDFKNLDFVFAVK